MSSKFHMQDRPNDKEENCNRPEIERIFPVCNKIPLGPKKAGSIPLNQIVEGIDFDDNNQQLISYK